MTSDERPVIWLCGATSLAEFRPARNWLEQRYQLVEISAEAGDDASAPVAILDVRDVYHPAAAATLEHWAASQPLAVVLQFLGPWCDGMGRSPGFLPGVVRVVWHRWEVELPVLLQPRSFLPRTATDADRILEQSRKRLGPLAGKIGVVAASRATETALSDAIEALGGQPICWQNPADFTPALVEQLVIDLDGSLDQDAWLESWFTVAEQTSIIVIAGFLRPETVHRWKLRGVAAVISKPLHLATLHAALHTFPQPTACGRSPTQSAGPPHTAQ